MPLSNYALENFVSQEMTRLTQGNAPEVTSDFPGSKSWVSGFILGSIFRYEIRPEVKSFVFVFLRRAEAAFNEYDNARAALSEFVGTDQTKKPSLCFRALHHFEMTIAMLWQAYDFGRKVVRPPKLFEPGDNSPYERLNFIYNESRHFNPADLPPGHLHAVWLTNDGIHAADRIVAFDELGVFLREIGCIADGIVSGPNHTKEADDEGDSSQEHKPR